MDIYKLASKLDLKFFTTKGIIEVKDLWHFKDDQLDSLARSINKILKQNDNDDGLSFLSPTTVVDVENQLRFDIVKDIYLTKKQEDEERLAKRKSKENNNKIDAIIARKKEQSLENMSIEELEKLRT